MKTTDRTREEMVQRIDKILRLMKPDDPSGTTIYRLVDMIELLLSDIEELTNAGN